MSDNENINNGYYAIIPATILYNNDLKPNEKLLYAIITSLACKEGYCFASNRYLAEKLGSKPNTVSGWISSLEKKNFIIVEFTKEDNKIIKRRIFINDTPHSIKIKYPSHKNRRGYTTKIER